MKTYKAVETNEPYTLKNKEKVRTDAEKYMRKIKKQYGGKTLDRLLKKGIQAVAINDTLKANPRTIHKANIKLISDIVLDKNIREVIAKEENMKKLSNRLEQRITLVGEQGETLAEFNIVGRTTTQVVQEMNTTFHKGEQWQKTAKNNKLGNLEMLGYNKPTHHSEGTINRIQIITILRKAK